MQIEGGWSTRELAELAGTTVKTVRHYHRIGLLEEPDRMSNGYKQYRVTHLVRLLRIRRLVDLGVALADIAAIRESDESAEQMFRALDAELAASIERQQRMREELAAILRDRNLVDLPPGSREAAGGLSEANRVFLLLGSRIFKPSVLDGLWDLYTVPRTGPAREFDVLTGETDEESRQRLAVRYASEISGDQQRYLRLRELSEQVAAGSDPQTWSVVRRGIVQMYNAAQIDVLRRIDAILWPDV